MSSANKAIMQRWFDEIWNQGREATIDELLAPDAVVHGLEHPESVGKMGPEAFKPFFRAFRGAFPDMHIEVEEIIAEDDRVVTRFSVRGTHTGGDLGMPPTGKPISVTGISIARLRDGQLVDGRNNIDLLTLYQQIDALPKL